jgi:predicted ribosome quality control (RQC) complex YloA/Tae2 family protein
MANNVEPIEELRKQVPAEEHDAEDKRRNKEQAKLLLACLHIKGEPMTAVKLEDARRVISAAEKKAREIGQPMNIAVADEGGNIVAHVRMDNAWIGSIDIAMKKAYTSRI